MYTGSKIAEAIVFSPATMALLPQDTMPRLCASRAVVTSRSTYFRQRSSPLTLSSIKEHPDPATDLDPEDEASAYQLKIVAEPDRNRRPTLTPPEKVPDSRDDGNRFGISVVTCRTSCCKIPARVEQISDWLHGLGPSLEGYCPSCKALCSFDKIHPPSPQPSSKISFLRHALLQRLQKNLSLSSLPPPSPPPPQPVPGHCVHSPSPPSPTALHSDYRSFNTDDEAYPDTEHTLVLGSSRFATDLYEMSARVTSIACLTLLLYALFI